MKQTGIINRIHKGLRTWLFETGIQIQQTDFLQVREGKVTISVLRKVLQVIKMKSTIDEMNVFPVLVTYAPYFVSLMDEENLKVRLVAEKLNRYIDNYIQPGTSGHYSAAGFNIQQGFIEFIGTILNYLNRMELMLNELYASDESGEFLETVERAIMLQIESSNRIIETEWIFKGLIDSELDGLLHNESILKTGWLKMELMNISDSRAMPQRKERMETTKFRMAAA